MAEKFRAEITGVGEDQWSNNACEYDTEQQAKEWLDNLTWTGYDRSRIVPVSTPTRERFSTSNILYQNYRR